MGSVKDLIRDDDSPGGKMYRAPTPHKLGLGAWKVSGRFSVADLKGRIPPTEIPQKGNILAMTAGLYWEKAASAGFQSSYEGMLDHDGGIVDVATLLQRGELSNIVVMRLAVTPQSLLGPLTAESRAEYHRMIAAGEITYYIADAECIFRLGFPLGSSSFKNMCEAVGIGSDYERAATYNETVALLDKAREIAAILDQPALDEVLRAAGLSHIPNPGYLMERPVLNFDTKFNPAGDQSLTFGEAQRDMGLDDDRFNAWLYTLRRNAKHQRSFCADRSIVNVDGKVEAMVVSGYPCFTDFACGPDENRLMLRWRGHDGRVWLIPTNKEIQRAVFRFHGIYQAKEFAQKRWGDDWLAHLDLVIRKGSIEKATAESVWMMEQAIATVGNLLLGQTVFEAEPIESWVGPFLPYASLEQ